MDSDVDVSGWVIELLLRDREKERIAKRVLAVAPFSDQDYRLKKTVLLRTIECEVCEASVSEAILETLEMIEGLDIGNGVSTTDAMKAAYLAVATECTVKFLVGLMGKPSGKYLDAVDRIWRGRVGALERSETSQLVTAELRRRLDEVEAGVWDLKVSKKLAKMNTRNDALRLVSVYVREALALLGPPFITWAIRLDVPKEVADLEGDQIAVVNGANVGGGGGGGGESEAAVNADSGGRLEVEARNAGEGFEFVVQMADGVNVGDGALDAEMRDENNVGGRSEFEGQVANGSNAGDELELEAEMESGDNVVDGSESEAQKGNVSSLGDGSPVAALQRVNGNNEHAEPRCQGKTTNGTNVGGESAIEVPPVSGADIGDGLEREMVNGDKVSYGSAQPTSGVQLQEVGAGTSQPTVSRGSGWKDSVETDAGLTNREVHRLADDQVRGEVNEIGAALTSANGEQGLSAGPTTKDKEIQRSTGVRQKHLAHRRTKGPVKIRDAEDLDTDSPNSKSNSLSTPEVITAKEALKSSMLELQSVVTDPLPSALRVSETIRSELVIKPVNPVNGKDSAAENQSLEKDAGPVQSDSETRANLSSSHQNDVPESSRKEKNIPNQPINQQNGTESVQNDYANRRNPGNQTNARPSLMERSTTARTYEWDDSIDMSQEERRKPTSRLHLPSPKRNAVSPLKQVENKRFNKRRKVKRWSTLEEATLRDAVNKYGKGNWKLILDAYRDTFVDRTEVDLKDKWRNLARF